MLTRDREDVEGSQVSRLSCRFHIEFRSEASNDFCLPAFCGKHSAQKKKIARLHGFYIGPERLRRRRQLDVEFS